MNVHKILFFIFLIIGLLAILCFVFPKEGFSLGSRRLFFPTLEEVLTHKRSQSAGEKMEALEQSMRMQIRLDSIKNAQQKAYLDTLNFYMNFFTSHPSRIYLPGTDFSFSYTQSCVHWFWYCRFS